MANTPGVLDRFVSGIEYDLHGTQNFEYKVLKYLNQCEKDVVDLNIL